MAKPKAVRAPAAPSVFTTDVELMRRILEDKKVKAPKSDHKANDQKAKDRKAKPRKTAAPVVTTTTTTTSTSTSTSTIDEVLDDDSDDDVVEHDEDTFDYTGGVRETVVSKDEFTPEELEEIDAAARIDLKTLPPTGWTEDVLDRYFNGLRDFDSEPLLLSVIWRQRRGVGYTYWLKCVFEHPSSKRKVVQWVRYSHLRCNPRYRCVIKRYDWNIAREIEEDAKLLEMPFDRDSSPYFSDNLENPAALSRALEYEKKTKEQSEKYRKKKKMMPLPIEYTNAPVPAPVPAQAPAKAPAQAPVTPTITMADD
jgi:hypothetical protein